MGELDALLTGCRDRSLDDWRRTRHIAALLYNINVDKKDRKSEAEYMPLWGDEAPKESAPLPPKVMMELLASTFNLTKVPRAA
ncbi:hypothetical protein [Spirosoma sp. 209]|uniref:hypothetical protein n=1 Tax=Spirosoma sp. 209 TaxID=1955701 RepID=UPI00098D0979|nr:hypothetical protein [Spirosoma sp. 209]